MILNKHVSLSSIALRQTQTNGFTTSEFLVEFVDLMDSVAMDTSNMLIAGDYNLHGQ